VVSVTPRLLSTSGKDRVPIVQEAVWAPGPVWTGAGNFLLIGIRSPVRPAHSQLLYRLRYTAHLHTCSSQQYKHMLCYHGTVTMQTFCATKYFIRLLTLQTPN
jgi:hypothetical protein